jgi:NAD(P)-dependent dehydrogenase (short-subunit alcohol dehydrogenase family)
MTTARRALVTGGGQGLGLAVVRRLAREGHSVLAVDREDARLSDAASEAFGASPTVRLERLDLGQPDAVVDLFRRLDAEDRSPELLVNAEALSQDARRLADLSLDALLDANLRTAFLTCQQAVKAMTRAGFGRIVNLTPPQTRLELDGHTASAASNLGLLGLTRALAKEVARLGITVNLVSPGLIRSELPALDDVQFEALRLRTPLQRAGTADEVAGLVNMLCGEDAGYVTGQCLSIDGGLG